MNLSMRKMAGFESHLFAKMAELGWLRWEWALIREPELRLRVTAGPFDAEDYQVLAENLQPDFNARYDEDGLVFETVFGDVYDPLIEED